jgi:hypothetical protein
MGWIRSDVSHFSEEVLAMLFHITMAQKGKRRTALHSLNPSVSNSILPVTPATFIAILRIERTSKCWEQSIVVIRIHLIVRTIKGYLIDIRAAIALRKFDDFCHNTSRRRGKKDKYTVAHKRQHCQLL